MNKGLKILAGTALSAAYVILAGVAISSTGGQFRTTERNHTR